MISVSTPDLHGASIACQAFFEKIRDGNLSGLAKAINASKEFLYESPDAMCRKSEM